MSSKLIGQKETQRRLAALENTKPLLRTVQLRAVKEAKARVHRATGHTARTIMPGDLTDSYTIVQASGAAIFLEGGTRPHTIRPRNASVLSWTAGKRLSGRSRTAGGRRFFAKVVHHPGTKPYPFLVPGAVAALKSVGIQPLIDEWNRAA